MNTPKKTRIPPTYAQIEVQRTEAEVIAAEGRTRYAAMTYEQGVRDALAWVLGDAEAPMEVPA